MSRRRVQPQGAGARGALESTSNPTPPIVAGSFIPGAAILNQITPVAANVALARRSDLSDAGSSRSSTPVSTASSFSMPHILDSAQLYQAYCGLQQEVSFLKTENIALKAELADLKLQQRPLANASEASDSSSVDMSVDVKKWGRYFSLFFNTFVTVSTFASPLPAVSFASNSATRYLTEANEAIGPTVELYEQIPVKYHAIMRLAAQSKGRKFVKLFRDAISSSRSSSISLLRNTCGPIIFNLPSIYFESEFSPKRMTIPEIRILLGYNADFAESEQGKKFPERAYDRFPPMLYKDEDSSKVENRFRNDKLFMICRAIVFGKKAAKSKALAIGREPSFYLRSDMPAATTFGLIALISGIARFTLSPDTRFDTGGIGPETGIDYSADISHYKKYLTVMHDDPSTAGYVIRLLKEWDAEVFSTHNAAMRRSLGDSDAEVIDMDNTVDEIEQDMQRLRVVEAAINTDPIIQSSIQDPEFNTMANNSSSTSNVQLQDSNSVPPSPIAAPPNRPLSSTESNNENELDSNAGSDFNPDHQDFGINIGMQTHSAEYTDNNIHEEEEIHASTSSKIIDHPADISADTDMLPAPRRFTRSDAIRSTKATIEIPGSPNIGFNPMQTVNAALNSHLPDIILDSAAVNRNNFEASNQRKAHPKRGAKTAARGQGRSGRK